VSAANKAAILEGPVSSNARLGDRPCATLATAGATPRRPAAVEASPPTHGARRSLHSCRACRSSGAATTTGRRETFVGSESIEGAKDFRAKHDQIEGRVYLCGLGSRAECGLGSIEPALIDEDVLPLANDGRASRGKAGFSHDDLGVGDPGAISSHTVLDHKTTV